MKKKTKKIYDPPWKATPTLEGEEAINFIKQAEKTAKRKPTKKDKERVAKALETYNSITERKKVGLHSPFGYVGYELTMIKTMIHLLDNLCTGCHTDEDYDHGCPTCPVGNLIYECKDYVASAYISRVKNKYMQKYNTKLKEVSARIKYLKPAPHFNADWIFQEERSKDRLEYLRESLKDLEFYFSQAWNPFLNRDDLKRKHKAKRKNGQRTKK